MVVVLFVYCGAISALPGASSLFIARQILNRLLCRLFVFISVKVKPFLAYTSSTCFLISGLMRKRNISVLGAVTMFSTSDSSSLDCFLGHSISDDIKKAKRDVATLLLPSRLAVFARENLKAGAKYSIKQVTIKEGHDLPTGTGAVRRKFRCADTVGHALLHRPCNSLSKISTGRYVGKTAIHGHLRTSSQLPKICNGSGSGTRRASTAFGHQILLVGPAQCFVERTGFCHIRCGTSGVGVGRTVGAPRMSRSAPLCMYCRD